MATTADFRRVVAERGRRIADEARARATQAQAPSAARPRGLLGRALELLPRQALAALRDALGPDERLEELRAGLARLRRDREDLRQREAVIDDARRDLDRARRGLDETRVELESREREAARLLARAERAAAEASIEQRVPLGRVRWAPEAAPRPIRGVARLAANIKRFGQLTPIVVRPAGEGFELVTGFRRMAALQAAGVTHARVRVVPDLDDATAAALYVAENCLVDGLPGNAVKHLAAADEKNPHPGFATVLPLVLADDEEAVEEMYLEDMAADARHHLAEGAAWVAALRPYWGDLEPEDRGPLEQLVLYFARVHKKLS